MALSITAVEKYKRLVKVKECDEQGMTDQQTADDLGLPIMTVKRLKKQLDDLTSFDLSPKDIAKRRGDVELELKEASELARDSYILERKDKKSVEAKRSFDSWMKAIELKMKLYGIDSSKSDNFVQINNVQAAPDKVSGKAAATIAKTLKEEHESRISSYEKF